MAAQATRRRPSLAAAVPPASPRRFGGGQFPAERITSLTFTLTNPAANTIPLTGVAFTDNLPAGHRGGVAQRPDQHLRRHVRGNCRREFRRPVGRLCGGQRFVYGLAERDGVIAGTANNTVTVTSTTAGAGNTPVPA